MLDQVKTPIFVNHKVRGRIQVGFVQAGTFIKEVHGSQHFIRKPPGIAFTTSTINDARKAGAEMIAIHDKETKRWFIATMATLMMKGFHREKTDDDQIELAFQHWKSNKAAAIQYFEEVDAKKGIVPTSAAV